MAYSHALEDVRKTQLIWEDGAIDKGQAREKTALELFKQDPELAAEYLTDYCLSHAEKVLDAWWKLGDDLLVKYNHFRIYDPEKRTARSLTIPEGWKEAVIKYDKLEPLNK